jgi:hypothetical protein
MKISFLGQVSRLSKSIYYFFKFVFLSVSLLFYLFLLFICAYNVWVISPPSPHLLPFPYPLPLPLIPSIPGRNYSALTSNFVEERA